MERATQGTPEPALAEDELEDGDEFSVGGSDVDIGFYEVRDNHTLDWKTTSTAEVERTSNTSALVTAHHGDAGATLPKGMWPRMDMPTFNQGPMTYLACPLFG